MASVATLDRRTNQGGLLNLIDDLNGRYHKIALRIFMVIVVAHIAEHLVQAFQIWVLDSPRPESRGILGQVFPWLVKSEALHYGYAIVMLVGLFLLRPGFTGKSRVWWNVALGIQFWHHIEHGILLGQAVAGANLFGKPMATSIAQLVVPRVELHLLYNTLVMIPMLVAMIFHVWPPQKDREAMECSCAAKPRRALAHAHV